MDSTGKCPLPPLAPRAALPDVTLQPRVCAARRDAALGFSLSSFFLFFFLFPFCSPGYRPANSFPLCF